MILAGPLRWAVARTGLVNLWFKGREGGRRLDSAPIYLQARRHP